MKINVRQPGLQGVAPVTLTSSSPEKASVKEVAGEGLLKLLAGGTVLPEVYTKGNLLIDKANAMTPQQLANVLQSHHLVSNSDAAMEQAHSFLGYLQSKGGNALLIGGLVGTLATATVVIVKPSAPLWVALGIGLAVFALVAGLLYWGLTDKTSDSKDAPKVEQTVKP